MEKETKHNERSFFIPHGRINRKAFTIRYLLLVAIFFGVGAIQSSAAETNFAEASLYLSYSIYYLLIVTFVKRLHDVGYSGWMAIILGFLAPLFMFLGGEKKDNAYGAVPPAN